MPLPPTSHRPTRAVINLEAIGHNVATLAETAGVELCAVVKADGYGHGAVAVARQALEAGASWLAVALVEEGRSLRQAGIHAPILILSEPPPATAEAMVADNLTATVYTREFAQALGAAARVQRRQAAVHVKADTGMARVGIPETGWESLLVEIAGVDGITITGLQTHLACADETDSSTTQRQLAAFERFVSLAASHQISPRMLHAANTAATLTCPQARYTMVRTGIGIYGLSPSDAVGAAAHGLRPAMTLVSQVSYVKRIAGGTPVSYGHRWVAPDDGWLATVPIGYADGVPRTAGPASTVWLADDRRPIAGSVCMDQLMVWCGTHEPSVGDDVVLFGDGPAPRIEDWARASGTITYEIATSVSSRVPRMWSATLP